jgi:hypothetical protein
VHFPTATSRFHALGRFDSAQLEDVRCLGALRAELSKCHICGRLTLVQAARFLKIYLAPSACLATSNSPSEKMILAYAKMNFAIRNIVLAHTDKLYHGPGWEADFSLASALTGPTCLSRH